MDDVAVGGGQVDANNGGLIVDEGALNEDFSKLSTQQKLTNSNWKARKEGLDEVAANAAPNKDVFLTSLPKLLKESNPSVLEAFFDAIIVIFGVISDGEVSALENDVLKLVVEKGITGRPKAVASCDKILKGLVMMPNAAHSASVSSKLSAAFSHKTPKNRQAAAASMASIMETFGPAKFQLKPLMTAIVPLMSDQNALVRKEAQAFAVQVYRHIGGGINPFLADLREVQMAELQKLFDSAAPIKSNGAGGGGGGGGGDDVDDDNPSVEKHSKSGDSAGNPILPPAPNDAHQFANAPDTVLKMPKELFNTATDKTVKWQDRNKAAQELFKPLSTAFKLRVSSDVDYTDLVKFMRDLLNDPQVPLNTTAFKAIHDLVRVLRDALSSYVRHLIPAVFEKFKDKKTSVLQDVYTTIGLFLSYRCCSFEQLQDEIDSALSSKIPHHRIAMVAWLNLIVPLLPAPSVKAKLARCQHFPKLLTDDKIEIRDNTLMLIGRIIAICGDGCVSPQLMNGLDAKQSAKVRQGMGDGGSDQAGPSSSTASKAQASSAALGDSPSKGLPSRRPTATADQLPTAAARSPRRSNNAPSTASASAAPTAAPVSARVAAGARRPTNVPPVATGFDYGDPGSFEGAMPSKMDAGNTLAAFLGEESHHLENLANKEWSKRQQAVAGIEAFARERWGPSECSKVLDSLVIQFQNEPSFKESIFQVNINVISCLLYVTRTASVVPTRSAFVVIQHLGLKLGDPKCKGPYKELLTAFAEGCGPRFVTKYLTTLMQTLNQPKLTIEGLDWVLRSLFEFNRSPVDAKAIIKYVKAHCFDTQTPAIKSAGVQLLVALRQRVGPDVDAFLTDVNPHLRTTIGAEIAKGVQPPMDVTMRVVKPTANEEPIPEQPMMMTPFSSNASPLTPTSGASASVSSQQAAAQSPSRTKSASNLKTAASGGASPSGGAASSGNLLGAGGIGFNNARRVSTVPGGTGGVSANNLLNVGAPSQGNISARGSTSSNPSMMSASESAIGPDGDTSALMPPLIKEIINGSDWKVRLNAVKKVETLLKPEGRTLSSAAATDVLKALKTRFDEVNKNLIVDVLRAMNTVVDAAGSNGRTGIKFVLPFVLNLLGDQKQQLRDEATYFCQVAFQTLGIEQVLPLVAKPLGNEAQFARLSIVGLVESVFEQYIQSQEQSTNPPPQLAPRHVQPLIAPLLKLLMDRLGDVRQGAEHILIYVIHVAGIDMVQKAVMDLRQQDQQQVRSSVERCLQQVAPQQLQQQRDFMENDDIDTSYAPPPPQQQQQQQQQQPQQQQHVQHRDPMSGSYNNFSNTLYATANNGGYSAQQQQQQIYQPQQQQAYRQPAQEEEDDNYLPAAASTISGSAPVTRGYSNQNQVRQANTPPPPQQQQQQYFQAQQPQQQFNGGYSTGNLNTNQSLNTSLRAGGGANVPPQSMVRSPIPSPSATLNNYTAQPAPQAPSSMHLNANHLVQQHQYNGAQQQSSTINNNSLFLSANQHPLADVIDGLERGSNEVALRVCTEFVRRFRADPTCLGEGNEAILAMASRLRRVIGSRSSDDLNAFLEQGMETPPPPRTEPVDAPLASSLTECLTSVFGQPSAVAFIEVKTLTTVFNVIIDSIMSDPPEQLVRGLNNFALGVVMKSPTDTAFRAMILCLADYTLPYLNISNQTNHKYMTLILKCLMRLDVTRLSPAVLISASHDYLEVHPPSQFRAKDDLAIRTIKTKIQSMCALHGQGLLQLAEEEGGPSSIVVHLVRAALDATRGNPAPTAAPAAAQQHSSGSSAITTGGAMHSSSSMSRMVAPSQPTTTSMPRSQVVPGQRPGHVSPSREGHAYAAAVPNLGASGSAARFQTANSGASQSSQSSQPFVRPVSPHKGAAPSAAKASSTAMPRRSVSPYDPAKASTSATRAAPTPSSSSASGFRQNAISPSRVGTATSHSTPAAASNQTRSGPTPQHSIAEKQHLMTSLGEIFSMARKPDETATGLQRMYDFIKSGATEDAAVRQRFDKHFGECSEPFRNYLGKRLNAAKVGDADGGNAVRMPPIVVDTLVAQGLATK